MTSAIDQQLRFDLFPVVGDQLDRLEESAVQGLGAWTDMSVSQQEQFN